MRMRNSVDEVIECTWGQRSWNSDERRLYLTTNMNENENEKTALRERTPGLKGPE
jgi:hypothetical protein